MIILINLTLVCGTMLVAFVLHASLPEWSMKHHSGEYRELWCGVWLSIMDDCSWYKLWLIGTATGIRLIIGFIVFFKINRRKAFVYLTIFNIDEHTNKRHTNNNSFMILDYIFLRARFATRFRTHTSNLFSPAPAIRHSYKCLWTME